MTNGDRIRQMTDKELARIFRNQDKCLLCLHSYDGTAKRGLCGGNCIEGIKAYLESEVTE